VNSVTFCDHIDGPGAVVLGTGKISRFLDAPIVGAGPYGLSIAAHLKGRGIDFRIFGKPMATWLYHMP